MKVAEVEITEKELKGLIFDYYCDAWKYTPMEAIKAAEVDGNDLMRLGKSWPVDTILEKRGTQLKGRRE